MVCSVKGCPNPATRQVEDLREVPSGHGERRHWESVFVGVCDKHKREPVKLSIYKGGSIEPGSVVTLPEGSTVEPAKPTE
jgi:hypothetical protein